jgi:hypothetical protein
MRWDVAYIVVTRMGTCVLELLQLQLCLTDHSLTVRLTQNCILSLLQLCQTISFLLSGLRFIFFARHCAVTFVARLCAANLKSPLVPPIEAFTNVHIGSYICQIGYEKDTSVQSGWYAEPGLSYWRGRTPPAVASRPQTTYDNKPGKRCIFRPSFLE